MCFNNLCQSARDKLGQQSNKLNSNEQYGGAIFGQVIQKFKCHLGHRYVRFIRYVYSVLFHNFFYWQGFQFVSDIGGALGLFMGASILSFVEVFQFLLEILNLLRSKIFVKRETTIIPVKEMMFYQRNEEMKEIS